MQVGVVELCSLMADRLAVNTVAPGERESVAAALTPAIGPCTARLPVMSKMGINSISVGSPVSLAEFAKDGIMITSLRVASCTGRLSLDR